MTEDMDKLEKFLNSLKGEVISIIPNTNTMFMCYGGKVDFLFIVEKVKK